MEDDDGFDFHWDIKLSNGLNVTENRLLEALNKLGLCPETQYPIGRLKLDFAFLDEKIDIEVNGPPHYTEEGKRKDKNRYFFLKGKGWKVKSFSANRVYYHPAEVAKEIAGLLGREVEEQSSLDTDNYGRGYRSSGWTPQEIKDQARGDHSEFLAGLEARKKQKEARMQQEAELKHVHFPARDREEEYKPKNKKPKRNKKIIAICLIAVAILLSVILISISNKPDALLNSTPEKIIQTPDEVKLFQFQDNPRTDEEIKQEIADKLAEYDEVTTNPMQRISVYNLASAWKLPRPEQPTLSGLGCGYTLEIKGFDILVKVLFYADCIGGRNKNGYSVEVIR